MVLNCLSVCLLVTYLMQAKLLARILLYVFCGTHNAVALLAKFFLFLLFCLFLSSFCCCHAFTFGNVTEVSHQTPITTTTTATITWLVILAAGDVRSSTANTLLAQTFVLPITHANRICSCVALCSCWCRQ